jgi:hypothetical protein
VDFTVTQINNEGKKETILIEVKPSKQTIPPKQRTKITKAYINEVKAWGINEAKWKACNEYCKDKGWSFQLFTEHNLGIKI